MKKTFVITVDIDTDRESQYGPGIAGITTDGEWRIEINKDYEHGVGYDLLSTLTHELGHILGAELLLPAANEDPRTGVAYKNAITRKVFNLPEPMFPDTPPKEVIIKSEKEAWEVGKTIFDEFKARSLMTYILYYPEEGER